MAETTTGNNVDQIRDLIFGSQIKEFEARFAQLERNIAEVEKGLQNHIQTVSAKLQRETERILEVLEKKIDNLTMSAQKERSKLRELIDASDEMLQSQLAAQKEEFATKIKVLKEGMEDEHRRLNEAMLTLQAEFAKALDEKLHAVDAQTVTKEAMAQMFLDVAVKLQGTDLANILQKGQSAGTDNTR